MAKKPPPITAGDVLAAIIATAVIVGGLTGLITGLCVHGATMRACQEDMRDAFDDDIPTDVLDYSDPIRDIRDWRDVWYERRQAEAKHEAEHKAQRSARHDHNLILRPNQEDPST